jgi:protein-L-isoaspartate(D-aspartate) O-methyltransferase
MRLGLAAGVILLGGVAVSGSPGTGDDPRTAARLEMVERHIAGAGISDPATLQAMRSVPRHAFVLPQYLDEAYENRPLPIGLGQTISQPCIVAYQTGVIRPRGDPVLEVERVRYQAVLAAAGLGSTRWRSSRSWPAHDDG